MSALDAPSSEVVGADSEFPPAITTQELIEGLTHLLELLSQELAELARHTQSVVVALKRSLRLQ